ncbi:hypothetical protein GWI33_007416 [Rhynchophorus ferrugineus]|uniref:Evolutionarily conserved signaling intermediate in Toll pathway, mitochondrial n=1 Tax=Rhynchophorus ferrugineus TaxID=354439 RepID=A0A834IKD1_RHYFE|nr:hypothetical protein GWI33_007416 [Rhynchophorus ferrugineus]
MFMPWNKNKDDEKAISVKDHFETVKNKNKKTYLEMINIYINRDHIYRRGHVEFIYSALKHMEEFGVQKDLEVYKSLIDVLPKGKFVPQNLIQAEFMHYPKQQQCIVDLLEQMEDNGVMPDLDMEDQLLAIFGSRGFPLRKYWRMMYWMPKFKNMSPFPLPNPLPDDIFELAKLAIERISNIDVSNEVTIYQSVDIKDSIEDTWIISAQSETQRRLLSENKQEDPIFVEGAFKVWLKGNPINYFILRGQPRTYTDEYEDFDNVENIKPLFISNKPSVKSLYKAVPTVHEQQDGVIYAVCATGTSSKDSLLSWIRHLEIDRNPMLGKLSVVFTLRSGVKEVAKVEEQEQIDEK